MNLNDFCAKEDYRDYLKTPCRVDDEVIATDGAIMVVMPAEGEYKEWPRDKDKIRKIISESFSCGVYQYVDLPVIEKQPCLRCGGDVGCPSCEGTGSFVKEYQPIEILGVTVQTQFIEKIQRQNFDDLRFAPSADKQKLYFKSGDVTGIIMAMRT